MMDYDRMKSRKKMKSYGKGTCKVNEHTGLDFPVLSFF